MSGLGQICIHLAAEEAGEEERVPLLGFFKDHKDEKNKQKEGKLKQHMFTFEQLEPSNDASFA